MTLYRADGLLMFWSHEPVAPWQTPEWIELMHRSLRPAQFLRMIENRWTVSEETFVTAAALDACTDPQHRPVVVNPELTVWVGVDASTKRDSTAIVATTWDPLEKTVWLVAHRIFTPAPGQPVQFAEIQRAVLDLCRRFRVRQVRYDPYQMAATAQTLRAQGVPMIEVPQTLGNLTEMSTNLYDLIQQRRLVLYPDPDVRAALLRSIAVESVRGWRLGKEKASAKIDAAVALALAAMGTIQQAYVRRPLTFGV